MRAFEISINGKKVCTAGIEEGVLSAILSLVMRAPEGESGEKALEGPKLEVGGLLTQGEGARENADWLSRDLTTGDEVTIRLVEVDSVDAPLRREALDTKAEEHRKREYYEKLKAEYGDE
jgi:hypothetical protein